MGASLLEANPASAEDSDFLLGEANSATAVTSLGATLDNGNSVQATLEIGNTGSGPSIYASNYGVFAAGTGPGVQSVTVGGPNSSPAVWGQNGSTGPGVSGDDLGTGTGPGVFGQVQNAGNTSPGVQGETAGSGPGVYGESVGSSGLTGYVASVVGDSNTNDGVTGLSSVANGIHGITSATFKQSGVYGEDTGSEGGYGLYGNSENGVALRANGVASFARSGLVSIAAGKGKKIVSDVDLYTSGPNGLGGMPSLVLANLQNSVPGVYIEAVVPDLPGSSFTIYLSENVPAGKTATMGWFVVN
jgi:hypothetical protein